MTDIKSLSSVEIKDATKGIVTAVISTFGEIDHDGDVTSKSTFSEGANVVVSSYGHTSWTGELPLGKGSISTSDKECIADLQFFMDTPHGKAAFDTIKGLGPLQEWSYSLENTVRKQGELDGVSCMFIESTDVKEVSPVLRGASIRSRTLSVKSDIDSPDPQAVVDAIRAYEKRNVGLKFSEHVDAVLADVDKLITRASEVMALRAEKGKTLSDESAAQLKVLRDRLGELVEPEPVIPPTFDRDEMDRIYLRLVASL